ncbi:MAG TPA: hypothetical protein VNZ23_16600, partial [Xanthobacteraceae bacterium]|nr:hypothetical protein [Xanthobacteraceae bacterium]
MRGDQGEQEQSSTVSAPTILGKTFKTIFRHVRATLCSDTFSSALGSYERGRHSTGETFGLYAAALHRR